MAKLKGRPARIIGTEPYKNRFGAIITLNVWERECARCGEMFEYATTVHRHDRLFTFNNRPFRRP